MKSRIIIATVIAIALFSTIVYANAGDNPGQIIDNPWGDPVTTTAPTTEVPTTTEEPTTEVPTETIPADGMYNVSPYRPSIDPSRFTHPNQPGKVFAGWFTDSSCETVFTGYFGKAYAKFVDEAILTVKFQKKNDKKALRFISSLSDENFETVGFTFTGQYGEKTIGETTKTMNTVYRTIVADGKTTYPTVFSNEASLFTVYTVRNINPEKSLSFDVAPFWVTLDGTKVTGPSAHYSNN